MLSSLHRLIVAVIFVSFSTSAYADNTSASAAQTRTPTATPTKTPTATPSPTPTCAAPAAASEACAVPCIMAAGALEVAGSPLIEPDPRNRKSEMCQNQCEIDFPSGNIFDDQEDEKNACLDACSDFRCDLTSCDAATGTAGGTRNNLGTNCRTMSGEEREGCLSACENACGPNPNPPC